MKPDPAKSKTLGCAIYTRVSTEHGLEQEFNSLDNQREAAEAYIKSQAHEGWRGLRERYDDGGFSGGSMERPALKQLLAEIRSRRIDVVVVYKVDRLTRSLTDFARLVELFDQHGVSFVSVTQAFNTTTSMGRLTLNVLLSFAQFEREVTGERIRDKIAASKQKGIWMGGVVPLGYRVSERALHIVEEHAALVREIYRRYLELGTVSALARHLDQSGVVVLQRLDSAGRTSGGGRFSRGHLHQLLSNPIYIGRIGHKGRVYDGQHPAIIDPAIWEAVQAQLASHAQTRTHRLQSSESLLVGRIRDDRGNPMTPSYAQKGTRRYRYYVSQAVLQGRKDEAGSVRRVPAPEIEAVAVKALRRMVEPGATATRDHPSTNGTAPITDRVLIEAMLDRIVVTRDALELTIRSADRQEAIRVPWTPPSSQRRREIIVPQERITNTRPIEAGARRRILHAIAKGRAWLAEIVAQGATTELIAEREGCSERSVRMMLSLASIAPDIVQAGIEGRLPRGIGLTRLTDLPLAWTEQRAALGLTSPAHALSLV